MMPTTDNLSVLDNDTLNQIKEVVYRKAQQYAPNHLANGIQATIEKGKSGYSIKLYVDLRKFPDARAQEYGSGESSTRNFKSKHQATVKGKIKIEGHPFLAFNWEIADKETLHWSRIAHWNKQRAGEADGLPSYAGEAPDGKLLFNWVMHPGIPPANSGRGYMKAALADTKDRVAEIARKGAVDNFKIKVRAVFSRPGGAKK